jgi:anti-anti-sigma factor
MRIDVENNGEYSALRLVGRMDLEGTEAASAAFEQVVGSVKAGDRLVIDFAGVDYISSAGIRVFVSAMKKMTAAGARSALCGLNAGVEEIFRFSGLDAVFDIHDSESAAAKACAAA